MSTAPAIPEDFKRPGRWDVLRLRPYGQTLLTPAVGVWLGFARIVILLMATIEAVVWGVVGASLVPEASAWLRPLAGVFLFALIFAVIWILDASLIMSERPSLRARRPDQPSALMAMLRWFAGLLTRLLIVAVSLYVTAPLLSRLIRNDDIEQYHQRQVERYQTERTSVLDARFAAARVPLERHYAERTAVLEESLARRAEVLDQERARRAGIDAEYAPELELLRRELLAAQQQLAAEVHGREGRVAGYGPKARRWEQLVDELEAERAQTQAARDARLDALMARIRELEAEQRSEQDALDALRRERQQRIEALRDELAAARPEVDPPPLTFAARSQALRALQANPAEQGVPHFETVEGFAQALLAILFFSLIALKFFEPVAVRAYFSESVQARYRQYLRGGLAEIPGFEGWNDPGLRLDAVEFVRLWMLYERDPDAFHAARIDAIRRCEPLIAAQDEQLLRRTLVEHRHENLAQELELARQRRERELAAYEQELELRIAQLRERLAAENEARLSQREEQLEDALRQARETWELRKAEEEEALRQRQRDFDAQLETAQDERRLRLRELVLDHRQRMEELRQAELAGEQERQTRRLEARLREEHAERELRLKSLRDELGGLRDEQTRQRKEQQVLRKRASEAREALEVARERVRGAEQAFSERRAQSDALKSALEQVNPSALPGLIRRLWSRAENGELAQIREARRELRALARERRSDETRLAHWRDERQALEVRYDDAASALRENETVLATLNRRIRFYEDHLAAAHKNLPKLLRS